MGQKTINTVIVLRNDQTTNWESSSYKLLPGEVGIGYLKKTINGKEVTNVIAKLGTDGNTAWADLPQIEGVFEDVLTLTHDFGRYKTSNGFVRAEDAVGMTTSQWLLHALSETKEPAITQPSADFSVSATGSGSEIGSYITALNHTGSFTAGTYEYGPTDTGVSESNVTWEFTNNVTSTKNTSKTGNFALDSTNRIQLTQEDSKTYATITGKWKIDATNAKTPVNNIGVETSGKFTTIEGTKTKNVTATSYRKAFWGVLAAGEALNTSALTSDLIRGLSKSSTSKNATPSKIEVPVGSQQVIIALKKGLKTTLTATDSKAQNATVGFTKMTTNIKVAGNNNYDPIDYDIWYVDWNPDKAEGYTGIGSAKSLDLAWS